MCDVEKNGFACLHERVGSQLGDIWELEFDSVVVPLAGGFRGCPAGVCIDRRPLALSLLDLLGILVHLQHGTFSVVNFAAGFQQAEVGNVALSEKDVGGPCAHRHLLLLC